MLWSCEDSWSDNGTQKNFCFLKFFMAFIEVVLQSGSGNSEGKGLGDRNSSSLCGSDSFMLRDGVCDEVTNIKACLFDGGDCCLEQKNEELCHNCMCKMNVDLSFIESKIKEENVKMFANHGHFRELIQLRAKLVKDVENIDTCSMLCLHNNNLDGKINSWLFNLTSQVCKCTWINTIMFLMHDIGAPLKDKNAGDAIIFIQMSKQFTTGQYQVRCSRLALANHFFAHRFSSQVFQNECQIHCNI